MAVAEVLNEYSADARQCIVTCSECRDNCVATLAHSLEKGGDLAEAAHIQVLLDCIEFSAVTHDYGLRRSPHYERVAAVYADICAACAESCKARSDDEQTRSCGEMCGKCASTCATVAG